MEDGEMEFVVAAPEMLESTAANAKRLASAIGSARANAVGSTTGLLTAAEDEVSAAIAKLFDNYGQQYQALVAQAEAFQSEFSRALAAAGEAYTQAEATNAAAFSGGVSNALKALAAPAQTLLGSAPTGGASSFSVTPLLSGTQVALIMGGTANPLPEFFYQLSVNNGYIQPLFPGANFQGLFTPEQFWPITPQLGNMSYGTSVAQGVALLDAGIKAQIAAGNKAIVFGYSQSAAIANNEIVHLMSLPPSLQPDPSKLAFVLAADPNNPDGGLLSRFPGFHIPFLNVDFNGATPPDSPYETWIYTAQYDGIAHAPRYPLNVLSDVNALLGYFFVHSTYPTLTPDQIANAVALPTSPNYTGNTHYNMIMTQDLPLVELIRMIPYAGPPIADIFQPSLRVLVDLGYGDMGTGFDYANVPTPASLISIPNWPVVAQYVLKGAIQGPYAAGVEIGVMAGWWGPEWFPQTYPWVPSPDPHLHIYLGQPSVTELSLLTNAAGSLLQLIPSFN
jgi:hypothetical protein